MAQSLGALKTMMVHTKKKLSATIVLHGTDIFIKCFYCSFIIFFYFSGRYGYIDPDGLKREYNYETGIKCDPNSRLSADEEETEKGYVDYQENKAVLPNGVRVDLTKMGKNSRRPQGQFYRN